jgi:ATP-binding protein involved in chromosome partitioning
MKIVVPLQGDEFSPHFGRSSGFALFDVPADGDRAPARTDLEAPVHEHGAFPAFLREQGVDVVLAGGMGPHAREGFADTGIQVVLGVSPDSPEGLVAAYLAGALVTGPNACVE